MTDTSRVVRRRLVLKDPDIIREELRAKQKAGKAEKRVENAVVVAFVAHGSSSEMHHNVGAQEFNKLLDDGWTVKSVHPMSSAGGNAPLLCFASIVIVSKSG